MTLRHVLPLTLLTGAALVSTVQAQTARNVRTTTVKQVTTQIGPVTSDSSTSTTAATSPVGFITTTCLANTDTNLTIPFTQPPVYVGASTGGANTSSTTGTISFSGTPFSGVSYKYVQGSQSTHYYAFVTGGTKEGAIYDITDNSTNTLTVNTNGDTISAIASGTQVRIVPHWTLGTAFTSLLPAIGSTTFGNAPAQVLLPDQTTPGTDALPTLTYYYYSGQAAGGAGWRKFGSPFTTIYNDTILYPETYFVLRNSTSNSLSFVPVGNVSTLATAVTSGSTQTIGVNVATVLNTLAANTDQDNAVGLPVAVDTTLTGSNLYQSGAFLGTSVFSAGAADELLLFDNTATGTDKIPTKTYYYYTGSAAGGPGWRQLGDSFTNLHNNDVIKAGAGFVVRKRATASPTSVVWNYRPIIAP